MSGNVQTILNRQINDWLYGYALSSAYRSHYVYDPDFALGKDPDIWEVIRRDPVIMSAMDRRSNAVVRPWRCIAPIDSKDKKDHQAAEVAEDAIRNIVRFNAGRKRLAEAAFLGRIYAYIEWEEKDVKLGGLDKMTWMVPVGLKDIDRRRIHIVADLIGDPNRRGQDPQGGPEWRYNPPMKAAGDYFETKLEMYSIARNRWEFVEPGFYDNLIDYTYNDTEDRVGYGRGLMEATYFYHYMKSVTMQKMAQGIDRWANGIIIGKLDSLRNASTGKTNEALRKGMEKLLREARSEHVIVMEQGDDIEIVEASGKGHESGMDFIHYLDEGIERLYNGSVRPSGMGGSKATGARAQAETEASSSEAFYQPFREDLDEVVSRDLIRQFWRVNWTNIQKAGLADAQLPKFTSQQEKMENRKDVAEVAAVMMGDLQLELVESELYRRTGWSVPGPGEKTVKVDQMLAAGGVGAGLSQGRGAGGQFAPKPGAKKPSHEEQKEKDKKKRDKGNMDSGKANPFTGKREPEWDN